MQTESMELGEFLESARKIRAEKDADRQFWLAKSDPLRADECHDGAKRLFKRLQDQQDPVRFSYLYPYIELKVHTLRRDWLEDIESLCKVIPNWKKLTWNEIRLEVLRHDQKIKSALKLKEQVKKSDTVRMKKYGTATSKEEAENEQEQMHFRGAWIDSGEDPAILEARKYGPFGGVLYPNDPNELSGIGSIPTKSTNELNVENERLTRTYVDWAMTLDEKTQCSFFRKRGSVCSRRAMIAFRIYAHDKIRPALFVGERADDIIRNVLKTNIELRSKLLRIIDRAKSVI